MKNEFLRVFRAFTDANRFRVLELLCDGEQCACVLLEDLEISQPTLSHHMKILCQSGIVKSRRVGPWNYYSIDTHGCEYADNLLGLVASKKLGVTLEIVGAAKRLLHTLRRKSAVKKQPLPDNAACCCGKSA